MHASPHFVGHIFERILAPAAIGLFFISPISPAAGQAHDGAARERIGPERSGGATTTLVIFTGRVLLPSGEPAAGALVATSAGGESTTAGDGFFALAAEVPVEAETVQVTALARTGDTSLLASARVAPGVASGTTDVGTLSLSTSGSCVPAWVPAFGGAAANAPIDALAVFDDELYAGGLFTSAGGVAANRIAKWNGTSWSALGSGVDVQVRALTVFDNGSGEALYAGGYFKNAGGVAANSIAKWNGASWSALGTGLTGSFASVWALAVFDDGSGEKLYAAGDFTLAGGVTANRIASWNGTSWSALGTGMSGGEGFSTVVYALAVFDDGSGEKLYAGGNFTTAGGVAANGIAKWNGTSWSAVGGGVDGSFDPTVWTLAVFDDGSGEALYAGGTFTTAGGVAAERIARWNGTNWSALGTGLQGGLVSTPHELAAFDDGDGAALYAGGDFTSAGGLAAINIAKWNGTSWSALGAGLSGGFFFPVSALAVFNDGDGPALLAGGSFTVSSSGDGILAKWAGCPDPCDPVTGLACGSAGEDVQLAWTNGASYANVEVRRDGALIATLAGTATAHVDPDVPSGSYTYSVRGICGFGVASADVECDVDHANPCFPVTGLACTQVFPDVELSWTSGDAYSEVKVYRDGGLLATLPGGSTTYTDDAPEIGSYTYTVEGICGVGRVASGVDCAIDHFCPGGASLTPRVGLGLNVPASLFENPPGNLPTAGNGAFAFAVDDPTDTCGIPPGSFTAVALSKTPAALSVPGWGCAGGLGQILISVSGPNPFLITAPQIWAGPGSPSVHPLPIPAETQFCGFTFHAQAAWIAAPFFVFPLSEALDVVIGS